MKTPQTPIRSFQPDEAVLTRDVRLSKWVPESIIRPLGPVSYETIDSSGRIHRRHLDHLRPSHPLPSLLEREGVVENENVSTGGAPTVVPTNNEPVAAGESSPELPSAANQEPLPVPGRPTRSRRAPVRFKDFVVDSTKTGGV